MSQEQASAGGTLLRQGTLVSAFAAGVLSGVSTAAGSASSNVTAGLTGLRATGAAPCSGVSKNSFCSGRARKGSIHAKVAATTSAEECQAIPRSPAPLLAAKGLWLHLHAHLCRKGSV